MADPKLVRFTYKNHRGEVALRQVVPKELLFGETEWYPGEKQWLLDAYDVVKGKQRVFAVKNITNWVPYSDSGAEG